MPLPPVRNDIVTRRHLFFFSLFPFFPFLSFRQASSPLTRCGAFRAYKILTPGEAMTHHTQPYCVTPGHDASCFKCGLNVLLADVSHLEPVSSRDNHVLKGSLSRSLRSFTCTAYLAHLLHSVTPFTGSLTSLTPLWDD